MTEPFTRNGCKTPANTWPLYGAVFAMATNLSVLWTAMPFIIRNIGGTEEHVGYAWAANMLGYVLCILPAARMMGHLNARHVTRTAVSTMLLAVGIMSLAAYMAITNDHSDNTTLVWIVIAAGTLAGAAMSLFWPFMLTWVSSDYEGAILNRRLGTYNGMWSAAAIMGPLLGGALVDANTLAPIIVAIAALTACLTLLSLAHDGSIGTAASAEHTDAPKVHLDQKTLLCFKWMARIVLFSSWACLGVSRSQFPLLFTEMGFSETQFGVVITMFGICNFTVLTVAGRSNFWHFRPEMLLGAQLLLALSLLLIIFGHGLYSFVPAFIIMGCSFGFAYSSHLYYGACTSKKRSTSMATHEVTLSLGVIVGAGAGGYIARTLGPYSPYFFAIIILSLGLLAQMTVWLVLRPGSKNQTIRDMPQD